MANNGTQFVAPNYDTTQILYGVGYLFTSPFGTSLPADIDLGDSTKWLSPNPWAYVGSTEAGVNTNFNPNMSELAIEEQVTPVASLVNTATYQVTTSMSEETLTHINLAYGGGGTVATVSQGVGQPGKSTLSLSSIFPTLACAVLGKNNLGYPRVFYIPKVQSAGQVQTAFRRAAQQRLYPITLNALCDLSQIQVIDITAAGS
jgi:hypothetical protein